MRRNDTLMLAALGLLAAFIWLRDLRWWDSAGDSLPILAALPLFYWLKSPWRMRDEAWRISTPPALVALILLPLGIAFDSGLVLALGWTALLWSWLSARIVDSTDPALKRLLILPVLAFPWITTDAAQVGWWFRLSGAAATEHLLAWSNFSVVREGTLLWVEDFAVSVEPACSGVNGLQAMLVAGGALAFIKLGHHALFWWNLPLLVGAAWLANLLRILAATLCGAVLDPYTAARWIDPVHSVAGWLALCLMFLLCTGIFAAQEKLLRLKWPRWMVAMPWLELVLLVYFGWRCQGLVQSWLTTPYDRLGWIAFLVWLVPLLWERGISAQHDVDARRRRWVGAAIALTFVGGAVDVNVLHHLGFASLLIALAARRRILVWAALGTFAWLPASGWIASRVGISPDTFAILRVILAATAATAGLGLFSTRRRTPPAAELIGEVADVGR